MKATTAGIWMDRNPVCTPRFSSATRMRSVSTEALRRSAPQTRTYVLTNFANDAYRRKAERLGARGFFDKSTEFEQLRTALVGIVRP